MRLENEKFGNIDSIGLRLPTELKEKIKNAAKENQQSMNAEIVRRLEASFAGSVQEKIDYLDKRIDELEKQVSHLMLVMAR